MAPLFLLALWPVVEIALFVLVGGQVGVWGVLGLVALGVLVGGAILRLSGPRAMADLRGAMARGQDPAPAMVTGALRAMAGMLFILPGFASDLVAALIMLPPVANVIVARIRARAVAAAPRETVIDGAYKDVTPDRQPTHEPSQWTRH